MITLVFGFENTLINNKAEYKIWRNLALSYKVDRVILIAKGYETNYHIDKGYEPEFEVVSTIEEALSITEAPYIELSKGGNIKLADFIPPKNCTYLFGWLNSPDYNIECDKLGISTITDIHFYSFCACSVLLNHILTIEEKSCHT